MLGGGLLAFLKMYFHRIQTPSAERSMSARQSMPTSSEDLSHLSFATAMSGRSSTGCLQRGCSTSYASALLVAVLWGAVICLCALYPTESRAQSAPDLQNSMRHKGVQSPTAASLGRFGEIPVSLYTGTPNVDVSLLELESFGLSIDLTYHSSGIKVSDIGGWVGMGWALQSGGVITRTVRGLPDDKDNNGYFYTGGETEEAWEEILTGRPFPGGSEGGELSYEQKLTGGLVDGQPDTFFFNIDGRTGQFVVGPDGEADIRTVPDQNLQFEATSGGPDEPSFGDRIIAMGGGFTEWQVTTEDGTTYVFADIEMTKQNSGESRVGQRQYVSAWYLSRIESPSGDNTVHFEYENGEPIEHEHPVYERFIAPTNTGCFMLQQYDGQEMIRQTQSTFSPILKKITTKNKEIIFTNSPREDIDNGYKLKEIKVYDRMSEEMSTSFELKYEYHASRLFLSEVQEIGTDGAQQAPHTFEYDTPQGLPSDRASLAVDHWGYYNGAAENETLLPVDMLTGEGSISAADRSPSETLAGRGTLQQINYPTGGHTHLEYEPHDYSMTGNPQEIHMEDKLAGGVRIKRITEHNGLSTDEDVVTEYRYKDPEDDNISSGVLVNKPIYQTQSPGSYYGVCDYVEISSSSYRGLGSTQGSIVGYGEVQVIHSEHGEVQHSFRDPYEVPDYDVDAVAYPFAPLSSVDWKRGQEQRRETIHSDGTTRTEESFHHNFHFNESQRIYPAIAYKSFLDHANSVTLIPHRYEVTSRWVYPTSETVTHIGESGEEATTTRSYTYEEDPSSAAFMQRRSEAVTTAAGTERTTTYEYAHEDHAPGMGPGGTHQLSEVYRTTVTNAAEEVLRRSWTTWQEHPQSASLGWVPHEEWVWTAPTGSVDDDFVEINSASSDELQEIIHVGPERAEAIKAFRPYASLEDLSRVDGLGAARIAEIRAQGLAHAYPTQSQYCIDVNSAAPDYLERIIHIGPDRAAEIEQLRPFESVENLDRVSGIGPARLADIQEQGVACAMP